jgi:hypothetical protein
VQHDTAAFVHCFKGDMNAVETQYRVTRTEHTISSFVDICIASRIELAPVRLPNNVSTSVTSFFL